MMMKSQAVRILVLHGDPVMAAGLAHVLGQQGDMTLAEAPAIDVVVADYCSALDFLARPPAPPLPGRRPGSAPRVMVISPNDREWEVRSAMNAGVDGYVLQACPLDELINGVRLLGRGSRYLCAAVARLIADSLTRETLTHRETDVLQLLTRGASNKMIAGELGIAIGTVKAHVKSILEKLDASTRAHAVTVATERGLVRLRPPPSAPRLAAAAVLDLPTAPRAVAAAGLRDYQAVRP